MIRGVQAFFIVINNMANPKKKPAYSRPRGRPAPEQPEQPAQPGQRGIGPTDIWDTIKAPLAGMWQGLGGRNLNYDQYIREKARKRRGLAPGSYPGRGPMGWLHRVMTGR